MPAGWRNDDLIQRRVIIAPERSARPHQLDFSPDAAAKDPFLEGHESETTDEILAIRKPGSQPNGPGWTVRVVPNRYPALEPVDFQSATDEKEFSPATGIHDVVIECPDFRACLSELPVSHMQDVVSIWRQRLEQISHEPGIRTATFFKNKGAAAGASLAHCHSQIIALPDVPPLLSSELASARQTFESSGRCAFDQLIRKEMAAAKRIVWVTDNFVALCPFASRFIGEVWVIPRSASSHFEHASSELTNEVAALMHSLLVRQRSVFNDPDYNIVLHSAPFDLQPVPWFRWHFELYPRIAGLAGFETGTGLFINPMAPEDAATQLREAEVEPA